MIDGLLSANHYNFLFRDAVLVLEVVDALLACGNQLVVVGEVAGDEVLCRLIHLIGNSLRDNREYSIAVCDSICCVTCNGNHIVRIPLTALAYDRTTYLESGRHIVFQIPTCATAYDLLVGNLNDLCFGTHISPVGHD